MVGRCFSEKQDPKESCKPQQEAWASLLCVSKGMMNGLV